MGRDWYWGGGGKASKRSDSAHQTNNPSGCISAVFHFFDFHHFQLPNLNHPHQPDEAPTSLESVTFLPQDPPAAALKGVEAPRNSLESEEDASSPLPSTSKDDEDRNLNIPMGMQIKTSGNRRTKMEAQNHDSSSSEISCSPGTKTPTLVARLMGLDLLPDNHSSTSSSSTPKSSHLLHHHLQPRKPLQTKITNDRHSSDGNFITGTRSLPETPRISAARRSDVDHHRLSLQINKENMSASEELVLSRLLSLKRKELRNDDENRSPGHYARQIVKQVKENVSRKVGMDVTNTVRNREQTRGELVSHFKSKKLLSKALTNKVVDDSSPGKHSTPSCSPRLRFLEPKNRPAATTNSSSSAKDHQLPLPPDHVDANIQQQPIKVQPKPKVEPVEEEQEPRSNKKCKKGSSDRFKMPQRITSDPIRNKQEEPFVRPSTANRVNIPDHKKSKKTPLSNDLLNITVPTLLPVKKDPSSPATKIQRKQVSDAQGSKRRPQLSSGSSQTYKQEATQSHDVRDGDSNGDRCNGATSITTGDVASATEYEYIARILRRTGIHKDTPVSFTKWFSPSHPLDPSIFNYLEHFNINGKAWSGYLGLRCNRKLLFYLVDEILVELLKPFISVKPWVSSTTRRGDIKGSELVESLCSKIRSFPGADCRVLEDIDALVDGDLPQMELQNAMAYEEEGEGIASEIERDILDTLVGETALDFGFGFKFKFASSAGVQC